MAGIQQPVTIKQYMQFKAELSEHNDLVLRGCRIVVLQQMRKEFLLKIHEGLQGVTTTIAAMEPHSYSTCPEARRGEV